MSFVFLISFSPDACLTGRIRGIAGDLVVFRSTYRMEDYRDGHI